MDGPRATPGWILVVEDDMDVRESLEQVLQLAGYRVAGAAHGLEALERLHDAPLERPALILLDLMMPVMDGRTFLAELRRDPALAPIPVAVLSAHGGLTKVEAAAHLKKPFDARALIELVVRFCGPAR